MPREQGGRLPEIFDEPLTDSLPAPRSGSADRDCGTDGLHDSALEGSGFELVWGFSCQVIVFGLKPVLCSEVCPGKASMFSRRQSCRGKSQSPVIRIAEEMETEPSKP